MIASPMLEAEPGDVWLYSRTDLASRMISVKTWSRFTHVEMVLSTERPSGLELFTSRIPDGVDFYPADLSDLALVLRSSQPFDPIAALAWAHSVVGQPYDLAGLASFWWAQYQGRDNGAQFCSECVTRCLRRGGIDPFPGADADAISPGMFATTPALRVVWRSTAEWHRWQDRQQQEIA